MSNKGMLLSRQSPHLGFLRHSPAQAMSGHFDQLCKWRSHDFDTGTAKTKQPRLPCGSPYVGSRRHAPPSPLLTFSALPAAFEFCPLDSTEEEECNDEGGASTHSSPFGDIFKSLDSDTFPGVEGGTVSHCRHSGETPGGLPDEAWEIVFSLIVDLPRIGSFARVTRGFSQLLKSPMVWAHRAVEVPFGMISGLAPQLDTWLPAWRQASKLVVPRSKQLLAKLSKDVPELPIEVAWRFDARLNGDGVEVINFGWSVKRVADAEEEFVVLGDAPLTQTVSATGLPPYLEVILDDRSADSAGDILNDFGIGVTAQPPSDIDELGSVADEVPLSWVVDFTKHSVVLSINNKEAAKGYGVSGEVLREGDRVGLRVTAAGTIEIFINGKLHEHLVPLPSECVPPGVDLFPVLDLYGCTARLSRTNAYEP